MYGWSKLNKNESGQAALEAAIILIAFVVVASVFAFAILSAGSASTEKGEQAIYSGLQGVQSSIELKGAVIAKSALQTKVDSIVFTIALVAGGDPVNIDDGANKQLIIAYRDDANQYPNVTWAVTSPMVVGDIDDLLEEGELAEITVTVPDALLVANHAFTVEVKPPTGGVLQINRTTPAALDKVMQLR